MSAVELGNFASGTNHSETETEGFWAWGRRKFKEMKESPYVESFLQHTDLIANIAIFVTDIAFVAVKLDEPESTALEELPFFILSSLGLLALNFQIDLCRKTKNDCVFAKKAGDKKTMALTAVNTGYIATSVLLTVGTFSAATCSISGLSNASSAIYKVLIPVGSVTVPVAVGRDICYFFLYRNAKQSVDQMDDLRPVLESLRSNALPSVEAARVRASMDKYTLKVLLEDGTEAATQAVRSNLDTQVKVDVAALGLQAIGYGLMEVDRLYPDTLFQAATNTTVSGAYLGGLCWKKWKQARQRQEIWQNGYTPLSASSDSESA